MNNNNITAFLTRTEVSGEYMQMFVTYLDEERILPLLSQYGISAIEADEWYPARSWLAALYELAYEDMSQTNVVVAGHGIARQLLQRHEGTHQPSLGEFLEYWSNLHLEYHRNGDAGQIEIVWEDDTAISIHHNTPYPDYLIYGITNGLAKRLLPKDSKYKVTFARSLASDDLSKTVIHLEWTE